MANNRGARVAAIFMVLLDASTFAQAQINYTGGAYTQNFNSLPASGTFSVVGPGPHDLSAGTINAAELIGWSFALVPGSTSADAKFSAGTGSSATGAVYSYGSVAQTERALGSLASGSVISRFGAVFLNDTPNTITRVTISYTGEQWRYGGSAAPNALRFSYAAGAADIANGAFVDVDGLTFTSPIGSGATGALDGNATANRVAISASLSGLAWLPGQTFVMRWTDEDDSGGDNGLAIEDLSFTTDAGTGPLQVTATTPANGVLTGYPNSAITVHFNHPVAVAGSWYQLRGSSTGLHDAVAPDAKETACMSRGGAFHEFRCTWAKRG